MLIPAQREPDTVGPRGGIKKGKVVEKECAYYADFVYWDTESGKRIVEDVKASKYFVTDVYKIKRKLMLQKYDIRIKEIY